MATEEAARAWKEELDKLCWEVSCDAEQADPGTCCEEELIMPDSVETLADLIDCLGLLRLVSNLHGVGVRVSHEDGKLYIFDYGTPEEDEMDVLADRQHEDEKDEALFDGGY